jgi:hypothetical protein
LISTGRLLSGIAVLLTLVRPASADVVRAEDYSSFWLWAGVKPQPALQTAGEMYILAGEVTDDDRPYIKSQRSAVPRVSKSRVWIVYRAQTMKWDEAILQSILLRMKSWEKAGNDLVGLQIDFDAGTKNLKNYAAFLSVVRDELPRKYRLSVTGLLDWSANGGPAGLAALGHVVDEVVLQIYQGRRVIPGYRQYFERLDSFDIPFRVGLLQGGEWAAPSGLEKHPKFRGYVVFLLNPD